MTEQQPDTAAGEAVLARAVAAYQATFGPRLIAAYALGSLAHGGFSPLVSDVDLGLILQDPLRPKDRLTIRNVARSLRAGGSALDQRLSVFWGTPATLQTQGQSQDQGQIQRQSQSQRQAGRFPPLDRLDLLEYGRLLTGRDVRSAVARPGQTELLVAGAEFALGFLAGSGTGSGTGTGTTNLPDRLRHWARLGRPHHDDATNEIRTPSLLVARGPRRMTKIVLFPVRFLFTAKTGQAGTNALAAEHYLAAASAPAKTLVSAALSWRLQPPPDDEATALLGRDLIPLYVHYLDDHITRLNAVNENRLAARFHRWRSRLLAKPEHSSETGQRNLTSSTGNTGSA